MPTSFIGSSSSTGEKELQSLANDNKPKRSKSLVARFRAGRKNPDSPIVFGDNDSEELIGGRRGSTHGAETTTTTTSTTEMSDYSFPSTLNVASNQAVKFNQEELNKSSRKDLNLPFGTTSITANLLGGAPLGVSKSLGQEGRHDGSVVAGGGGGGGGGLGRRPSVMQRLFRGKNKTLV